MTHAVRSVDRQLRHDGVDHVKVRPSSERACAAIAVPRDDVVAEKRTIAVTHKDRAEDSRESTTSPPAEGERRAIGGYYPQYRLAAALILRGLRDGTLEAIRLADPEAGHVDDVQIIGRDRRDAFQVKWSRYGEPPLTFRELITPDRSSPPLIACSW